MRSVLYLFCLISPLMVFSQQVFIDGLFQDWENPDLHVEDRDDYLTGVGIESASFHYDNNYFYLQFKVSEEILLQELNNISVALDFDNNPDTGFGSGDIGAEMIFNFGSRSGFLTVNNSFFPIAHKDIGLITAPTVSSDRFEIAIARQFVSQNMIFQMGEEIAIFMSSDGESGDVIPEGSSLVFTMNESREVILPDYDIERADAADFRLMSLNALRDNIFEFEVRNRFGRLMKAVDADIYCFQEIYEHSASEVRGLLEELEVISDADNWHSVKQGPDLVTVSRFPIVFSRTVGNNAVVVLDVEGSELLIINAHLPCCENDFGRELEIDQILQFIRRSKDNVSTYHLEENTPYIICGDMNFVGDASQPENLRTGNIYDNGFFGPDVVMDWDGSALTDMVAVLTGVPASFTWINRNSSFFPGRLDYIYYTDAVLEELNSFILYSSGLDQQEQIDYQIGETFSQTVSDHLPIVADFRVMNPSTTYETEAIYNLYPNPGNGILNIKGLDFNKLEIYDSSGQRVFVQSHAAPVIETGLPPGWYLLVIYTGKNTRISVPYVVNHS